MAVWWQLWRLFLSKVLMLVQMTKSEQTELIQLPWTAQHLLTVQRVDLISIFAKCTFCSAWFFLWGKMGEETEEESIKTGLNFEKVKVSEAKHRMRQLRMQSCAGRVVGGSIDTAWYEGTKISAGVCAKQTHTHTKAKNKTKCWKGKVCQVCRKRNPSNFGSTTLENVKNQKLKFLWAHSWFTWSQDGDKISALGYKTPNWV